ATVVLTLLVLSLALHEPKSARVNMIALIGAIVTAVSVAAAFVFGLIGLGHDFEPDGLLLYHLIDVFLTLVIPVLCAIVMFLVYTGTKPAPSYQHPQQYGGAPGQMGGGFGPGQPGVPQGSGQPQQAPPAGGQPTWAPDQASGGAWQSAGQAASGASATEWGQPGQQQGWSAGSAMSATEHTGPIPTGPAPGQPGQPGGQPGQPSNQWGGQPENQWQPVDPNNPHPDQR
ncbi:MAG: hypothetical protein Q4F67_13375, partial [Propionibacteriaceae bacterium]|nr:hypothetical protein [Propionibacteriaceae bacterium]